MEIKAISLELRNFKGQKNLSVSFDLEHTVISGMNGTGKSTIFDAFVWLMFGKDSRNSSVFNIKTVDDAGQPIHKLEHEVEGILMLDGTQIKFRRTYKEKWVTRRGSAEEVMDGHETLYAIDDVPVLAGEYQRRVSQILQEDVFRMITDPLYFNSKNWKDRRKVLIDMAGTINDTDILNSKAEFQPLVEQLGSKTIEEFKTLLNAKKQPIEKNLKEIPARIDEVDRNMPEEEDWERLATEADSIKSEIDEIDASILDRSKPIEKFYESQSARTNRIHEINTELQKIVHAAKLRQQSENNKLQAKRRKIESDIDIATKDVKDLNGRISEYARIIEQAEKKRQEYLKQWHQVDEEQFIMPEDAFICPTCKQELEPDSRDGKEAEMRKNFADDKMKRLAEIQGNGRRQKQIVEDTTINKDNLDKRVSGLGQEIKKNRDEMARIPEPSTEPTLTAEELTEVASLTQERDSLNAKQSEQPNPPTIDVSDLQEKKKELKTELDELTRKYAKRERIAELQKRRNELLSEQKTQAEKKAELQKLEMLIMEFTKTKMALVDERVNGRFKYVRFRMFDTQINGEEIECCDPLIEGVPYPDANHAARINAGIDIINALCEFYGVTAPIFIDNRESVNTLIDTTSQIISLIVTRDKELVIN